MATSNQDDSIVLKRWMIVSVLTIGTAIFSSAMWLSRIESTTKEIPVLKENMVVALQVLADHGTEFKNLRERNTQISASVENLRETLRESTRDRWHKSDAQREWNFHRDREHGGKYGEVRHSHDEFGNDTPIERVSP